MFNKGMSYHSPPSSWTEAKIIKWRVLNDQTCPYLYINIMIIGIYKNIAGTYYFKTLPKYCFCFNLKKILLSIKESEDIVLIISGSLMNFTVLLPSEH